jgi:hypothetical protein
MKRFKKTLLTVATAAALVAGCSAQNATEIGAYVDSLPAWENPAPRGDEILASNTTIVVKDNDNGEQTRFACTTELHEVTENYDEIMALGDAWADLKPGMLVQGKSVREGTLRPLPLPRSPVTLSISVAAETATRTVENPNSATLQQAVSELQRETERTLDDLPAQVSYSIESVQSMEATALSVGIDMDYSGPMFDTGLDLAFKNNQSKTQHTVVVKLRQQMYTISFADDALPNSADFFADDVTEDDIAAMEAQGMIGPSNTPAYVKSVSYGRIVLFTVTSSSVTSGDELRAAIEASFDGFVSSGSIETDLERSRRETIQSAKTEILVWGGSSADATEAIRTGNYIDLLTPAKATTALPVTYRINNLKSPRPVAVIGDTLTYETEFCVETTELGELLPGLLMKSYESKGSMTGTAGERLAKIQSTLGKKVYDGESLTFSVSQPENTAHLFNGYLKIEKAGRYRFWIEGDDVVHFVINGRSATSVHGDGGKPLFVTLDEGFHRVSGLHWNGPAFAKFRVYIASMDDDDPNTELSSDMLFHEVSNL